MKLYANYQNTKAIFSEVCSAALICLEQLPVLGALFRHAADFNIPSPDFAQWSQAQLPQCPGLHSQIFILLWDDYPFLAFPKGIYLFNIKRTEWFCVIFLKKKKKKTFNYLKTKMLLYQSLPAVLLALTPGARLLECHKLHEGIIHCITQHTFHFPGQSIRQGMVF